MNIKRNIVTVMLPAILTTGVWQAQAEPSLSQLVPADKQLAPAWVESLTARGEPEVYSGAELKYIGMPIGGMFAGQVYLGGQGQLWHWDIFNEGFFTGWAGHYGGILPTKKLEQGFSLKIGDKVISLDSKGFSDVRFRGEYPVGTVTYQDTAVPVQVKLEAFSPFIPLNTDDSSLPATIMSFTLRNTSGNAVQAVLTGYLENFVLFKERGAVTGTRNNTILEQADHITVESSVEQTAVKSQGPDVLIEDWSKENLDGWSVEGAPFAKVAISKNRNFDAEYKKSAGENASFVKLLSPIPVNQGGKAEEVSGKLRSNPFLISRKHLYFWICQGNFPSKTAFNLIVDGKVVATAYGNRGEQLKVEGINLEPFQGKTGMIEMSEKSSGNNLSVGRIFQSDGYGLATPFKELPDYGTMALTLLDGKAAESSGKQSVSIEEKLVGSLGQSVTLAPGEEKTVRFVVTWHLPNLNNIPKVKVQGQSYAARFKSASEVASYVATNEKRLIEQTMLWRKTWYDSTLPYWFLDRTMINTSILATTTCFRFQDGRFWAWEGIGSCAGTCGHVYGYAQSIARLFPQIEQEQREKVDFTISQKPDGGIRNRGEQGEGPSIDAQAYYILRTLREHQMSPDNAFLIRVWSKVKLAMNYMIAQDGQESGVIHGGQHNTLDADWYGEVSWYSGLYQAALLASAEMADLQNDPDYAARCRKIAETGEKYMAENLFNGEYYQNKVDPAHPETINSGAGCEIDQVSGQAWAFQVGLPRVFPKTETVKSLQSLWRYNYAPDVGPYRAVFKAGRRYADPGEAGVILCTFPKPEWDYIKASGGKDGMFAGYFNESMTGFEHQLAGHMIWEGMVQEGLAIERSIHDRYTARKRNPYNEVECGDHYGRAMASYGVFIAACGYEYDGPKGHIGFDPRIKPENFRAPFTAAEGWGTFAQQIANGSLTARVALAYGSLRVQSISLVKPLAGDSPPAKILLNGQPVPCTTHLEGTKTILTLNKPVTLQAGQSLDITF